MLDFYHLKSTSVLVLFCNETQLVNFIAVSIKEAIPEHDRLLPCIPIGTLLKRSYLGRLIGADDLIDPVPVVNERIEAECGRTRLEKENVALLVPQFFFSGVSTESLAKVSECFRKPFRISLARLFLNKFGRVYNLQEIDRAANTHLMIFRRGGRRCLLGEAERYAIDEPELMLVAELTPMVLSLAEREIDHATSLEQNTLVASFVLKL